MTSLAPLCVVVPIGKWCFPMGSRECVHTSTPQGVQGFGSVLAPISKHHSVGLCEQPLQA